MQVKDKPFTSGIEYEFGQTMLFAAFTFSSKGTSHGDLEELGRKLFNYGQYISTTEDKRHHVFQGIPIGGRSMLYFHVPTYVRAIPRRR